MIRSFETKKVRHGGGENLDDEMLLGAMVRNICHSNAERYLNLNYTIDSVRPRAKTLRQPP